MTDRELLEAAAKAAGMADAEWRDMAGWGEVRYGYSQAIWSAAYFDETDRGYWNPLTDDADALRLGCAIGMGLQIRKVVGASLGEAAVTVGPHRAVVGYSDDPMTAVRRAIVRAAASLVGTQSHTGGRE